MKHAPLAIGSIMIAVAGFLAYQYWLFAFRYEQNFRLIPLILIGLPGALGIFIALRQNWARKLAIGYSIFQIVISSPAVAYLTFRLIKDISLLPKFYLNIAVPFATLIGYGLLAYILTRLSIKKEF